MSGQHDTCPDCEGALGPIRMLDATDRGAGHTGTFHVSLRYMRSEPEPPRSLFGLVGTVQAFLCNQCGRILLYGDPEPPAA